MKSKYIEERFDGPWHINGNCIETPSSDTICIIDPPEPPLLAIKRYNELLEFTTQMADAFDKAAPNEFKQFYYVSSVRGFT